MLFYTEEKYTRGSHCEECCAKHARLIGNHPEASTSLLRFARNDQKDCFPS